MKKVRATLLVVVASFLLSSCGSIGKAISSSLFSSAEKSLESDFDSADSSSSSSPSSSASDSSSSAASSTSSDSSSSSSSSTSSSASSSQSSSSSASSSSGKAVPTGLLASDNIKNYTLGETFDSISDLNVTLVYSDGSTKDISKKSSYYSVALKDPLGHSISSKSPFTIKGLYSAVLTYRGNTAISSSVLSLNVGDNVSQTLTEKTSATTAFNYADLEASCLSNLSFPTTGEVHGLVIPIEFTDYPFSQSAYGSDYLSAINRAFNGNGKTDTGYWESVASYYSKSSLGKLNFSFDIAPVYASGKATSDLLASYGEYSGSLFMGSSALNDYVKNHGSDSTQKFDGDKDGYIDGVWFVYSAPDYASGAYNAYPSSMSLFWAFCTDSLGYEANLASPALHSFGWSSIDFLSKQTSAPKVDAHTFIHETGHLLSLPDYYSYDRTGASSSGPLGGLAMMDLNIGDQDSFSKIALGWADPYVVTDSCTITIKPNESSGDAILLADRWNGTAFDEYLLLDLQTPTGVNQSDSLASYNFRPTYYSVPGVRMLHVDSRMGKFQYLNAAESGSNAGIFCIPDSQTGDYHLIQNLFS